MSLSEAYSASSRGFIQNFGRSRVSPGPARYAVQREWMESGRLDWRGLSAFRVCSLASLSWLRREIARKPQSSQLRHRSGRRIFRLRL